MLTISPLHQVWHRGRARRGPGFCWSSSCGGVVIMAGLCWPGDRSCQPHRGDSTVMPCLPVPAVIKTGTCSVANVRITSRMFVLFVSAIFVFCFLCKPFKEKILHCYSFSWTDNCFRRCTSFKYFFQNYLNLEWSSLWGGSKGVINFPWIFYAMRSLVPVGHFQNISRHLLTWLVCGSFQWRHGLLFTDCIMWEWDDKDKGIGFSHWIHLGWWPPKLQLFQLSQHSHVTSCWLIPSSAYFPLNKTLKYKMQLSEGSWDKILHSKLRIQCFSKEEIFLSGGLPLEAIHQSSGSNFCDFFLKTT